MVAGGDGYEMLAGKVNYREFNALDEVVIDYINSGNAVITEEPIGRIKFVDGYISEDLEKPTTDDKVEVYNSNNSSVKPVVIEGSLYLPVRALVVDVFGGEVNYDAETGDVIAKANGETFSYNVESTNLINNRTYLPHSFSENFGYEVSYEAEDQSIQIFAY